MARFEIVILLSLAVLTIERARQALMIRIFIHRAIWMKTVRACLVPVDKLVHVPLSIINQQRLMCSWQRPRAGFASGDRRPLILTIHIVNKCRCWVCPLVRRIDSRECAERYIPIRNMHKLVVDRPTYSRR